MDELQRAYFSLRFENRYLRSTGESFQDLFRDVMELAYPGDFIPVRPHGNKGDMKCDGYRSGGRIVFQCYAPKGMKLDRLIAKMEEDFHGAVRHWGGRMASWVFVHNDYHGLPAPALQRLEDFAAKVDGVETGHWAYAELRDIVSTLPLDRLEILLGAAPGKSQVVQVANEDIDLVIRAVRRSEPNLDSPLKAPSPEKLRANNLSAAVATLLTAGRLGEPAVDVFLSTHFDPGLGEAAADAFRSEYVSLKRQGLSSNEIFDSLLSFVGGNSGGAKHQAAALAVLCYFFERCDVFEDVVAVP